MTNLLETIQTGRQSKPPRVLLYGVEGIGKSTFGSEAPKPIFIQTEDGLDEIDCDRFPLATTRALVTAIVTGKMAAAPLTEPDPIFRLRSPVSVADADGVPIPAGVLDPKAAWEARGAGAEYDAAARRLAAMFVKNWADRGFPAELTPYGPVSEAAEH